MICYGRWQLRNEYDIIWNILIVNHLNYWLGLINPKQNYILFLIVIHCHSTFNNPASIPNDSGTRSYLSLSASHLCNPLSIWFIFPSSPRILPSFVFAVIINNCFLPQFRYDSSSNKLINFCLFHPTFSVSYLQLNLNFPCQFLTPHPRIAPENLLKQHRLWSGKLTELPRPL